MVCSLATISLSSRTLLHWLTLYFVTNALSDRLDPTQTDHHIRRTEVCVCVCVCVSVCVGPTDGGGVVENNKNFLLLSGRKHCFTGRSATLPTELCRRQAVPPLVSALFTMYRYFVKFCVILDSSVLVSGLYIDRKWTVLLNWMTLTLGTSAKLRNDD
jgi:hypothetical protein